MQRTTKTIENKDLINEYLDSVSNMSTSTAYQYKFRLDNFRHFVNTEFNLSIDNLIVQLEKGAFDLYHAFFKYLTYLCSTINGRILSPTTIKTRINTARGFLESQSEIEISERKCRLRVKIPKSIVKTRDALSKTEVIDIINSCSDIRLRTYVLILAATGMGAVEALSTRICDYDLDSIHPTRL
jgi:integrase